MGVKKSFIQSIADKNAKVVALCEYLGTLRTECMRTYQKARANTANESIRAMHALWLDISELEEKLEGEIGSYVLSDNATINRNYESVRNLVLSVDKKNNHKNAFVAYFDNHIDDKKNNLPLFYSVSECSSYVTKLYNEYLSTLESVREERAKRERLADKKARLLAELAELDEEE